MRLSLRQLQAFVLTARQRSFSRAAAALGVSQPALSQAISDLEADIGYALFDRTTRRVSLTTAGRQFLPSAERVVNAYGSARDDIARLAQGGSGRVTIACLPSVAFGLLPRVMSAFAADFPDIVVEIVEQKADQVIASVRSGEVDLGIANIVGSCDGLNVELLLEDEFALVCGRTSKLARTHSVPWSDLAGQPLIAMTPDSGIWKEMQPAIDRLEGKVSIRYVASNPGTILALVAAGVGVAPLPGLAWPAPNDPVLVHRPLINPKVHRRLHIFRRLDEPMGPGMRLIMPYVIDASRGLARAISKSRAARP